MAQWNRISLQNSPTPSLLIRNVSSEPSKQP
jgi:hypothetical protein